MHSLEVSVQRRVKTDSNTLDSSKEINISIPSYPKENVLWGIAEAQEYTDLRKQATSENYTKESKNSKRNMFCINSKSNLPSLPTNPEKVISYSSLLLVTRLIFATQSWWDLVLLADEICETWENQIMFLDLCLHGVLGFIES